MSTPLPILLCPFCDAAHVLRPLPPGARARCRRCGSPLYARRRGTVAAAARLHLAAVPLFAAAHLLPFVGLELGGREQTTTVLSAALALWRHGIWWLAALVFTLMFLVPLARLLAALHLLRPLARGRLPSRAATTFRILERFCPWAMTDVYLMALVVAWAKLRDLGLLEPRPALFAFVAMLALLLWAEAVLEPLKVWERIAPQTRLTPTALATGRWIACPHCRQTLPADREGRPCPRCGGRVHARTPGSLARTTAWLLAATFAYVPANLLPVMTVVWLGRGEPDTILSGVAALYGAGLWPVATVIFLASIVVPVAKILVLAGLLAGIRTGRIAHPRLATALYRAVDAVGRWSMIDVFVVGILTALVSAGRLATVEPGPGISAFAATVVFTMIAAHVLDPRLLWDRAGARHVRVPLRPAAAGA